jgi:hypothetical protein
MQRGEAESREGVVDHSEMVIIQVISLHISGIRVVCSRKLYRDGVKGICDVETCLSLCPKCRYEECDGNSRIYLFSRVILIN